MIGLKVRNVRARLLLATALVTLMASPAPLLAQTTEGDVSEGDGAETEATNFNDQPIIVTGSRIRRDGFETLQPTTVIGAEILADRAVTSVGDAINELPSMSIPGASPTGTQSGVSVGQNFVNFFGLGSQRTLTLVDGRRFPPANTPSVNGPSAPGLQVDLNTIPLALIERVETVAVGGAPIYGSDAIAGTVNIILKEKFEGFEANALTGITERGDAAKFRIQALYGLSFGEDDRGNIIVNAEWNRQDPLRQTARKEVKAQYSFQAPANPDSPFLNELITDSRAVITNLNGVPLFTRAFNIFGGGVRDANGGLVQFSPSGDLVPFDVGTPSGSPIFYSGGDGLSLADTHSLLAQVDRYYANLFVNYELTDTIKMKAQGWYSHTDAVETVNQPIYTAHAFTQRGGPNADRDGRFFTGPMVIRLNNAFLTNQARSIIASNLTGPNLDIDGDGIRETEGFYLDKGNADLLRGNPSRSAQDMYRASIGFEGNFGVGERRWDWDLFYGFGRVRSKSTNRTLLVDRLNQAVDAVFDGSGNIVCRDQSNGCVPLNVFTNNPDPAAVDWVGVNASTTTELTQHVVSANLTGALFKLPGGDLSFALGAEYRKEQSSFTPDFILTTTQIPGTPTTAISGKFDTKEVYGEAVIPLIGPDMNFPLVHRLEAEGAVRYVDNSIAGGDLTWTAGGRYMPIEDIEFRGNFTRSIRNPSITELFLPTAGIFTFAADPCDSRFVSQGNFPDRRAANCAADGITQPFGSLIVNRTLSATLSGNPNLDSEVADAYTFGVVLRPRFIPGLTASVDWTKIELNNAIASLDATTILQACYDSADFPNVEVCSNFDRDADGQVSRLDTGYRNAGALRFAGLTANLSYNKGLGSFGAINFGINYQYVDQLETSVTGTDFNDNRGEIGNSKHRGNANIRFTRGGFGLFLQGQYVGSAVFDNSDTETTRNIKGVSDWAIFNLAVSQEMDERLTLRLAIDNLLDASVPRYATQGFQGGDGGINTYFQGVIGRAFSLSAKVRF